MEEKRGLENIVEEKTPARCRSVEPPQFQKVLKLRGYRAFYCSENMSMCRYALNEMLAVPAEKERRIDYFNVCTCVTIKRGY